MKLKQMIALGCVALGIVLLGYGIHSRNSIASARGEIQKMSESKNRIVKSASRNAEMKVGQYSSKLKWCFILGGVLVVVGGGLLYWDRKNKHHHH